MRGSRSFLAPWLASAALLGCGEDNHNQTKGSGGASPLGGAPGGGTSARPAGAAGTIGRAAAAGAMSEAGAPGAGFTAGGGTASGGSGPGSAGAAGTAGGTPQAGDGGTTAGSGGTASAGAAQGAASGSAGAGGSTHTGVWRIMPFGDSITDSTCYPKLLSKRLKDNGKTNFEFVGTRTNNQSCNGAVDVKTEGHGGYLVTYLVDDSKASMSKGSRMELNQWVTMTTPPPDVVLMHFGTNDVWNGIPPATITSAYTFVLNEYRAKNPNLVIFAAMILPMHPNGCVDSTASCENNRVKALNAAIPDWAAQASTPTSPIHVVDVYASVDAAAFAPNGALTMDGVHPNVTASDAMAKAWYDALVAKAIP